MRLYADSSEYMSKVTWSLAARWKAMVKKNDERITDMTETNLENIEELLCELAAHSSKLRYDASHMRQDMRGETLRLAAQVGLQSQAKFYTWRAYFEDFFARCTGNDGYTGNDGDEDTEEYDGDERAPTKKIRAGTD